MCDGGVVEVDSALYKGSITEKPGRAQSDRFYERKWPLLNGPGSSDFVCPGGVPFASLLFVEFIKGVS